MGKPVQGIPELMGMPIDMDEIFGKLYNHALTGDADCGGLISYNYFSGEPVTYSDRRTSVIRTYSKR